MSEYVVRAESRSRLVRFLRLWHVGFRHPVAWRESKERVVVADQGVTRANVRS